MCAGGEGLRGEGGGEKRMVLFSRDMYLEHTIYLVFCPSSVDTRKEGGGVVGGHPTLLQRLVLPPRQASLPPQQPPLVSLPLPQRAAAATAAAAAAGTTSSTFFSSTAGTGGAATTVSATTTGAAGAAGAASSVAEVVEVVAPPAEGMCTPLRRSSYLPRREKTLWLMGWKGGRVGGGVRGKGEGKQGTPERERVCACVCRGGRTHKKERACTHKHTLQ